MRRRSSFAVRPICIGLAIVTAGPIAVGAQPEATSLAKIAAAQVTGVVVDEGNGLPIPRARIALYRGSAEVGTPVETDAAGNYAIANVTPGFYTIEVRARGYETSQSTGFAATPGASVAVNLVVTIARAGATHLRTIGSVTASGASALASTTTITRTLDPAVVQEENGIRLADQLAHLPGVNGQGLSSSVGDDTYLNIRGLGASETVALLDGHPVGPQGVYGINGGGTYPTSFNYADTPLYGLSKVQVTFGSGSTGLYGVDAIGGTVDLQTIEPTQKFELSGLEGLGNQGRQSTGGLATGTIGRLGYAIAAGVSGTYGLFSPQVIAQTGRPNNNTNNPGNGACTAGNDISACNLALNTYSVSQNTVVKGGLGKLKYNLSNATSVTGTLYASGSQSDSTGNGDNDNIPYNTRLAQIQATQAPSCALPGSAATATDGYTVVTSAAGATACDTAARWASASSGPFGGGADRNRGTDMTDYHLRVQSAAGKQTIIADGFHNYYKYYKSSQEAAGFNDASMTSYAGTAYSQYLNTNGVLLADDITLPKGDVGFGYFNEYQLGTRRNYDGSTGLYSYSPSETTHYNSGFARANLTFSPGFSTYTNFWIKHSSVDNTTSFDPRVSLVFRPRPSDVLRLTYGHSTGDPAAELKATGAPVINGNPSSFNPSCGVPNSIGTGGNPIIRPERANDYEVGYAHRFDVESNVQVNAYYTRVGDQLFSAVQPLTQFNNGNVGLTAQQLAGYIGKLAAAGCNVSAANLASAYPFLGISTTFNASQATSKGIELTGRQRLTSRLAVEYSYDLQSATEQGVSNAILLNNPFIVNGGQIQGVPINSGNVALEYRSPGGFSGRIDGYIVGTNNPKERPGYNTFDGFLAQQLQHNITLTVGITNIFNEATQNYGYFGSHVFIPENPNFSDTTSIQQYLSTGSGELFGAPQRSFQFTASYRS